VIRVFVRAYEELNDRLQPKRRKRTFELETEGRVLADILDSLGIPPGEVDLALIDGAPATLADPVFDGARVALYPTFERFDISRLQRLRARPLRSPRFRADEELVALARRLRLLGFDCACESEGTMREDSATEPPRILLVRAPTQPCPAVTHCVALVADTPEEQLRELCSALDLIRLFRPGSRCPRCNVELAEEVAPREAERLETQESRRSKRSCPRCSKPLPGAALLRRVVRAALSPASAIGRQRSQ
jgi:uncharacterized protein with PIN domain